MHIKERDNFRRRRVERRGPPVEACSRGPRVPEAVYGESLHHGVDIHGRAVRDTQDCVLVWARDGRDGRHDVGVRFPRARGAAVVATVAFGPRLTIFCDIWKGI